MTVPPFVALTGGIGSGKSTALASLERLGCAVISSDAVVHELYRSPAVVEAVVARFGDAVAPDGVVDRSALAAKIFASADGREWLEQLLWPLVRERVAVWRAACEAELPPPRALIVEVPLLFEAGMQASYDATIAVSAPEQLRDARARSRGHAAVDERAARQLSQDQKAALATYTVANDGDLGALEQKLSSVLAMLGV